MPLSVVSTNTEKVPVGAHPVDGGGNPQNLDGPLTVEVLSGPSGFEIVDALNFNVVSSADADSVTQYRVTGMSNGDPVVDTIEYTVSTGAVVVDLGLAAGAPIPK